jgi:predicted O-methyltransferase YrrM
MNGFWELLIRPALEAAGAREIVEVGSEGGLHTLRLLEWCAARGARLHVIEPEPQYDVAAMRAAHPGRLVFHEATSLERLDAIGPVDAVLLDGDHNWYTVYHELLALEAASAPGFPLVLLHDVAWPFARRDLYYAPGRIPGPYRHPYAKGGVRRGESKLLQDEGLAPELYKALEEGGPRNGVLTAVEDFLEKTSLRLRFELVPVDFGLGFLASEALLAARPALRELLDGLEAPDFGLRLALHMEERRIDCMVPLQRENDRLRREVTRVVHELGEYQAELGRHEVEVKRLRGMLADVHAEIAAARVEIAASHAERAAAQAESAAAHAEAARVVSSRSWRLTAPLRRAAALLRGRGDTGR